MEGFGQGDLTARHYNTYPQLLKKRAKIRKPGESGLTEKGVLQMNVATRVIAAAVEADPPEEPRPKPIVETEYRRRLRRLSAHDNIKRYEIVEVSADQTALRSKLLGKIVLNEEIAAEMETAAARFVYSGTYDLYANHSDLWRQAVVGNKSGDATFGETLEHNEPVQWTENALHLPRLVTVLQRHIDLSHVRTIRVFTVNTGGFIVSHRDYLEFVTGFNRLHLPVKTANGAITVEGRTAFWMRSGELWLLESRVPHTAGNFASTARHHLAIDCDPSVPLAAVVHDLAPAGTIAMVKRPRPPKSTEAMAHDLSASITTLNVRSLLNAVTEAMFVHEIGAAEVHDVLRLAAAINGDPTVIAKVADLRELLLGTDPV
jgi:hypothetical protein